MNEFLPIRFELNGEQVEVKAASDVNMSLLKYLREKRGLTGAKDGCSNADCGTCTVIIDGQAVRSCKIPLAKMTGKKIQTIEGLPENGKLHALQVAFITEGAIQCGFCTPGMLMSAKALLDRNPTPTENDIRKALRTNLCRCTGYVSIIRAVQQAARMLTAGEEFVDPKTIKFGPDSSKLIGISVLDKNVIGKVTGQLKFGDDHYKEGMLIGKIKWSDFPSARILSINTEKAIAIPGVKLILTAKDILGENKLGILIKDQPAIAYDRVRCISDPIATVFATTEKIAQQAVEMIDIQYEPLPGVFSAEEAAAPDAPKVHESGNICHQAFIKRGHPENAFRNAAIVIEDTYTTQVIDQAFLEPESGLAWPNGDGKIVVEIGTQTCFDDRDQLSIVLGLPEDKIQVRQIATGGAFGAKEDIILQTFLTLGALKTDRPVKMVLTREESFRAHPKRHSSTLHFKTAASADGMLQAVEANIVVDTGAYASLGPDVLENMVSFCAGPYYVPNLDIQATAYYTNNIPCGAMRGFGSPQVAFGMEQQMDRMARALEIDPFEFRLKNALDIGLPLATDHVLESSVGIKQTLQETRKKLAQIKLPEVQDGKFIGVGLASGLKNVGFGHGSVEEAGAYIELTKDGEFLIRGGTHEYGQGTLTVMMQIVASEIGLRYDQVKLSFTDTATSPKTGPTTASRQTFLSGNAMILASRDLKKKILTFVEDEFRLPASEFEIQDGKLIHLTTGRSFGFDELNTNLLGEARYRAPSTDAFTFKPSSFGSKGFISRRTHWAYSFVTHLAIVEVNKITGEVKVLKFIAAQDAGRVLNPMNVRGQIEGGVVQGLGYALLEELKLKDGFNQTTNLRTYNIPTSLDVPEIYPIAVEDPVPEGPFGAKGVGEAAIIPSAVAIVNAIYDAVGVRITSLPVTKEKLFAALREKES